MGTETFQSSVFENRLYVYGGITEESLVNFGVNKGLPVICHPTVSQRLKLSQGTYTNQFCHPFTSQNPEGYFKMHPSNGYSLKYLVYVSSNDSNLIKDAIKIAVSSKEGPRYRTHHWVLRKPEVIKYWDGQKLIDLPTVHRISSDIVLTKEFTGMKWTDREVIPTEDKLHRSILRTFEVNYYNDFDVSSYGPRNKGYYIFGDDLMQLTYRTRSGYLLTVIGVPKRRFSHGLLFKLKKSQINVLKHNRVPYKSFGFHEGMFEVGILHPSERKVKQLLGIESSSDFVRLAQSIVSIGDFIYQPKSGENGNEVSREPLPFTVDREPEEMFFHEK
ncbi:MAG: hypothetical protein NTW30_03865 [Candidatus Aenigmarchaeota archaeon]|nr:hypothetical protein [Candidatus Aenigmarchaeota archaeon]